MATGAIALLVAQTLSTPSHQFDAYVFQHPCCYLVSTWKFSLTSRREYFPTFYDTRKFSLTSRRNFSKWQLFTKTCSFYRLGFGGHSAPNRPISDQHRINQSAISIFHHFLTFDLMIFFFFFYSSPDSSHTLWWIVEYSGGETSTLCQLEVSVWPCVCSTGCSRLVTHPGTNPARRCLTSVIWREPVRHRHMVYALEWYGHSSGSKQTIQHFPATFWSLTLWNVLERSIWAQFSVETNNRSALRQGHWIQSVSTEMLVVVWCSSWKGRDSRKGVLSIYIRRCLCLVEREVFFLLFITLRFFCRSERSLRVGLSRFLSQFFTNISGTGESKWRLLAQATSERGKCGRICSSACSSPSRMHITQIA